MNEKYTFFSNNQNLSGDLKINSAFFIFIRFFRRLNVLPIVAQLCLGRLPTIIVLLWERQ